MPDYPYMPQPNGGLLGQFSALAGAGIDAWDKNRRYQQEVNLQKQQQQAGLLSKGLMTDPETGEVKRTPEADTAYKQQTALSDAGSPESIRKRNSLKAALSVIHPDLPKAITDDMTGNEAQGYFDQVKPMVSGEYNVKAKAAGVDISNRRLQASNEKAAQQSVNKDTILSTYSQRADGAKKILNLMTAAEKGDFKSNQAMLGQLNAEISRLETGSQSPGLNAAEKTEMQDSAAKFHDVLDTLTGNVTGVDLSQKFAQAKGMVKDLGNSYLDQINNRHDFLKAAALPGTEHIFDAKKAQHEKAYGSAFQSEPSGLVPKGMISGGAQVSPQDQQAIDWAKSHPQDPRSAQILKLHGM